MYNGPWRPGGGALTSTKQQAQTLHFRQEVSLPHQHEEVFHFAQQQTSQWKPCNSDNEKHHHPELLLSPNGLCFKAPLPMASFFPIKQGSSHLFAGLTYSFLLIQNCNSLSLPNKHIFAGKIISSFIFKVDRTELFAAELYTANYYHTHKPLTSLQMQQVLC